MYFASDIQNPLLLHRHSKRRLFGYKPCWKHTLMLSCVSWSPGKSPCFCEFDRYPSFGVGTVGERTRTYFVGIAGGATENWARTWPTLGKSAGLKTLDCE